MARTKIVATLGPASSSDETILALMRAGVDVFRLNMSHGEIKAHTALIRRLKSLPKRHGLEPAGILADLCGPKVRVGTLKGGSAELVKGEKVTLLSREVEGDSGSFHVSYDSLGEGLGRGARVLIADGMLELRVLSAKRGEVVCRVVKGGLLKERKGVNFPGLPLELPSVTDKDRRDLAAVLGAGVDYVALSFVREASDVAGLKALIKKAGSDVPVISKVERPEAVRNIRAVVDASDGIMVARGDLGVEMPPELVPALQKRIIRLCNERGKPVITATQMLESMVSNIRPTRAEASDVAGAVQDGTDALMLSEETAAGAYPVEAVVMMDRIAREAEKHMKDSPPGEGRVTSGMEAIARAACSSSADLGSKAIICFTRSGRTALQLAKQKPRAPIIAATPDVQAFRRMRLYYGVVPVKLRLKPDTDGMLREVENAALRRGLVRKGDNVILTLGVPAASDAPTNLMKVHRIGEAVK